MEWNYEIRVCPFCGAPAEYEGGYEGYGWIFECDHDSYSEEYGAVEPLAIAVMPEGIAGALAKAASKLEAQRQKIAAEKRERAESEAARRAALTPEQRAAEDRRREARNELFRSVVLSYTSRLHRQFLSD